MYPISYSLKKVGITNTIQVKYHQRDAIYCINFNEIHKNTNIFEDWENLDDLLS